MDITKQEVAAVREVAAKVEECVSELMDLELAMVGGGCGEVLLG